jgi:hypothetical protein
VTDKPVPLDLTRHAHLIEGAREFLRMWARPDGLTTCFVNPVPLGPDPAAFGAVLVDAVRRGAKAYARAVNIDEAEALARIWESFDAERARPTDDFIQIVKRS